MTQKRSLAIEGFNGEIRGVILPMGLRVDRIVLSANDVKLSHPPFSVDSASPGHLEVFISERDIAAFLNKLAPGGLKNITVQAKNGVLNIHAVKTVLIDVHADAVCSLRIVDKKKLFVDLESVEMLGVGPKQLIQSQLDKVNPVIDIADLPIEGSLESVDASGGAIRLVGRVLPPAPQG